MPDPSERAFRKILIAPEFIPQLDFVEAKVSTSFGDISTSWRRSGNSVTLDVRIPANTSATLRLPGKPDRALSAGHYEFTVN